MDITQKVHSLLLRNRRTVDKFQYTVPSPETYPYQWLWDSCFHAIILSYFDTADSKKELLSAISHQFENGMVPHITYWQSKDKKGVSQGPHFRNHFLREIDWGKDDTSTITQPPLIAFASLKVYQKDADKKSLEKIYPSIKNFCTYLINERDPHHKHLAGIINPDESGEDNSPRFDSALELPPKQTMEENFEKRLKLVEDNKVCKFDAPNCMHNFFWIKDTAFNCILVEELKAASEIAGILGHHKEREFFIDQSNLVKQAIRDLMYEDNIFWSTQGPNYKKIKVKSWAIFAPLFAGIPTQEEAQTLVEEHLLNFEEFHTTYLLPTVPKDEPSFDPKGFWRGPIWMSTNWFVFQGLKRYGFEKEAQKILDITLSLLEKEGFREYYNPLTGEGMGARDFTWGGLVIDMINNS